MYIICIGPIVYGNVLNGIVSWGPKACGDPKFPGVYTKVAAFIPWISNNLN